MSRSRIRAGAYYPIDQNDLEEKSSGRVSLLKPLEYLPAPDNPVVKAFSPEEQSVYEYYVRRFSYQDIGDFLELSRFQVCRIVKGFQAKLEFMEKLRTDLKNDDLVLAKFLELEKNDYAKKAGELLEYCASRKMTGRAYRCLMALVKETYGKNRDEVLTSKAGLAALTGIHIRNVYVAMRELLAAGVISCRSFRVGTLVKMVRQENVGSVVSDSVKSDSMG